jgi:tetratricopeptide (TPR) repeat protein
MKPLLVSLFAFSLAVAQEEGKRVALVIGNDTYSIRPLQNAVNDARLMQKALEGARFRVISRENAGKAAMEESVSQFLEQIGPGDTALIFYAGHAVQIEGENVLIPVDFTSARSIIDAKFKSFSMTRVFSELKRSRAKTVIVVIDACRTNPVAESHALQAGLANPSDAGKNTYVAFSTSPNSVAGDNPNGRNSWFTEALADAVALPNLTLDDVFTRVRLRVEKSTGGKQTPWSTTSLTSKFYFHPPATNMAETDESLVAKWRDDMLSNEQYENWQEAIELAERIIKQKPGGSVEETAKARLPYLRIRDEAEKKFEAGDFAAAIHNYEQSLKLEPFAVDAGFEAANSALLTGDFKRAVQDLEAVRHRGATPQVKRAEEMLKELAKVEPSAAEALKRGLAKAPPMGELFPAAHFGVPDWEATRRWAREVSRPVDYVAFAKKLPPPAISAQAAPVATVAAAAPPAAAPDEPRITLDDLYVEVKSVAGSRDLVSEEMGELTVRSKKKGMGVMLEGKPVSRQTPFTMKLPAGEYDLRTVEAGKKMGERRIKIKPNATTELDLL